jgi:beta-ureidopropionase / N-carbamoyl-L-amino-acid hydrolase
VSGPTVRPGSPSPAQSPADSHTGSFVDPADSHTGSFVALWEALLPVGRDPRTGGYRRLAWTAADAQCRDWFAAAAAARGLDVETDRNGNLWAWWGVPGPGAVVLGSHLDSVTDGGAFDGPLGVASAFAALDAVRASLPSPASPAAPAAPAGRPVAVAAFADEEGARFGVACLGSRLATGAMDPDRARALSDADGVTLAEAMSSAGHDPAHLGPDHEALDRIGSFVELHVEQGRRLVDLDTPVGLASVIWPHGRYRLSFSGAANHAGTTRLEDRRDPMLTFAHTVLAARDRAAQAGARATIGRVEVEPNGTNAVPSVVRAWLDARAPSQDGLDELVAGIAAAAGERAGRDRTGLEVAVESLAPLVEFDPALTDRLAAVLGDPPRLPTQAGHDAGVLAARVPAAMLFVRNPSGVSHSPAEHAEPEDCLAGVAALARVLAAEVAR